MLHTFLQTDYTGQMLRNSLAKSCEGMPTLCSVENLLLLVEPGRNGDSFGAQEVVRLWFTINGKEEKCPL